MISGNKSLSTYAMTTLLSHNEISKLRTKILRFRCPTILCTYIQYQS